MCNFAVRRSSSRAQDLLSLFSSLRPCLSPGFPVVQKTAASWAPLSFCQWAPPIPRKISFQPCGLAGPKDSPLCAYRNRNTSPYWLQNPAPGCQNELLTFKTSQGQGAVAPCWVRRRLLARALVTHRHTHFELHAKLFCVALLSRACPTIYKWQELNIFFSFPLLKYFIFISLSYVSMCLCVWVWPSENRCPGNPAEGVGVPVAGVTHGL